MREVRKREEDRQRVGRVGEGVGEGKGKGCREEYLDMSGMKMERQLPQPRLAASPAAPSGDCSCPAAAGRQKSRRPLQAEPRIRLMTDWNGNETVIGEPCSIAKERRCLNLQPHKPSLAMGSKPSCLHLIRLAVCCDGLSMSSGQEPLSQTLFVIKGHPTHTLAYAYS